MTDFKGIPFHFYRDFRDRKRCYIGIKKKTITLDLIDALYEAAENDFPGINKSEIRLIFAEVDEPFGIGLWLEVVDEIPDKYQELKFSIKTK